MTPHYLPAYHAWLARPLPRRLLPCDPAHCSVCHVWCWHDGLFPVRCPEHTSLPGDGGLPRWSHKGREEPEPAPVVGTQGRLW